MPIIVVCSKCSAKLSAPDSAAGKRVRCPKATCGTIVAVPEPLPIDLENAEAAPPAPVSKRSIAETANAPARTKLPARKAQGDEYDPDENAPKPARRKRKPALDEEEEDRPARNRRRSTEDEDEEDDRPVRKRRRPVDDDEDDDRDRPRRYGKKKQQASGLSPVVIGAIAGGALILVLGVVLAIYLSSNSKGKDSTASSGSGGESTSGSGSSGTSDGSGTSGSSETSSGSGTSVGSGTTGSSGTSGSSQPVATTQNEEDPAKAELMKLNGAWKVMSMTIGGKTIDQKEIGDTVVFKDGDFKWVNGTGLPGKVKSIDPTKRPKEIDYETSDGKSQKAIYKLEGDAFSDCVSLKGTPRPKEFRSTRDNGIIVLVYKRIGRIVDKKAGPTSQNGVLRSIEPEHIHLKLFAERTASNLAIYRRSKSWVD